MNGADVVTSSDSLESMFSRCVSWANEKSGVLFGYNVYDRRSYCGGLQQSGHAWLQVECISMRHCILGDRG